jgi:hypothetical protein
MRAWRANDAILACESCFTAVARVRELEQREAEQAAALGYEEVEDDDRGDMLSAATRILYRVAQSVCKTSGKGHALVRLETLDGETWACHMPGCELCEVATLAQRFLDGVY